ncbi:MAG TPA: hypothetical protein VMS21_07035 [Methylomirabilota bacterium]|nr:hypothetical protein [Methylomirabilota bacterium]
MKSEPDNIDVLQNIEHAVITVFRERPEMNDHVVQRAYDAAFERYRAETRGHPIKPCMLTGLDREVFDAVVRMCEFRLGRAGLDGDLSGAMAPIALDALLNCLRELRKSVERHTRASGRQGYLGFVEGFI